MKATMWGLRHARMMLISSSNLLMAEEVPATSGLRHLTATSVMPSSTALYTCSHACVPEEAITTLGKAERSARDSSLKVNHVHAYGALLSQPLWTVNNTSF